MQIAIKIPDWLYEKILKRAEIAPHDIAIFEKWVLEGTPLPKGHGRLIDADAFIKAECSRCDGQCGVCDCDCLNCKSEYRCEFIKDVDSEDVIIEADKEVDNAELQSDT